jgi:hypothetical protein
MPHSSLTSLTPRPARNNSKTHNAATPQRREPRGGRRTAPPARRPGAGHRPVRPPARGAARNEPAVTHGPLAPLVAQTTSPRDRKRLLRTLIADVTLLLEQDSDTVRIGVRWHTGASDELTIDRRGPGRTPPQALAMVREYGATHSNVQIAKMLNDAWLKTGKTCASHPGTSQPCAASTRSSPHAPSPFRTGRSASNGPLRSSAYPQTRSTTGCATTRSLPASAL